MKTLIITVLTMATLIFATDYVEVTKPQANVRSGPNKKSKIIKTLNKGYKVELIGKKGLYYRIVLNDGRTGYVYNTLVRKVEYEVTNIAVMELEGNRLNNEDLEALTNRLRNELFQTKKFVVLERSQMSVILKEQGFQQTGCTNTECAVEAGQLLNVDRIVLGNVDYIGGMFTVSIRMVDVGSGEVVNTATEDCRCDISEVMRVTIHNVARKLGGLEPDREPQSFSPRTKQTYPTTTQAQIAIWERIGILKETYIEYQKLYLSDKKIMELVKFDISPELYRQKPWKKLKAPFFIWKKHHKKTAKEIVALWRGHYLNPRPKDSLFHVQIPIYSVTFFEMKSITSSEINANYEMKHFYSNFTHFWLKYKRHNIFFGLETFHDTLILNNPINDYHGWTTSRDSSYFRNEFYGFYFSYLFDLITLFNINTYSAGLSIGSITDEYFNSDKWWNLSGGSWVPNPTMIVTEYSHNYNLAFSFNIDFTYYFLKHFGIGLYCKTNIWLVSDLGFDIKPGAKLSF